jgi:hypothetical protein
MPRPIERAVSGSRDGPRTIKAITRITISSIGEGERKPTPPGYLSLSTTSIWPHILASYDEP